jgi:stearoyl-CoA desaturase (delta-9 desaturase)
MTALARNAVGDRGAGSTFRKIGSTLRRWIDNQHGGDVPPDRRGRKVDWVRCLPFVFLHVACLGVIFTGTSTVAVLVAIAFYAIRMFAITGFYHRYFSHRSFKTSRPAQFVFALLGASAVQRGPLWWAGHHRNHHRYSDEPEDLHSPRQHGLIWSHIGWITSYEAFRTPLAQVPDLARFPELRFLDRFDTTVPLLLAAAMYGLGELLAAVAPSLGTNGWQMVVWGFFISTVVLFHATCTINSLSHVFGKRRYATDDDSRNNPFLAMLTFGEGWHNNHHHFPHSARQGFAWWEIDLTYYGLFLLQKLGIIWDVRPVPVEVYPGRPKPAGESLETPKSGA